MDLNKLPENLDFLSNSINRQALVYSFFNILTISLFAGLGISYELTDSTIEDFINLLEREEAPEKYRDKNFIINISENKLDFTPIKNLQTYAYGKYDFVYKLNPLLALYSKAKPLIFNDKNINDSTLFKIEFDNTKYEKKIIPKVQALLIINEVNLSKHLYNNSIINRSTESSNGEKLIGLILLHSAIEQAIFCKNYLRNSNRFFVVKKDMSKYFYDFDLIEDWNDIDWEDQSYMILAFASLFNLLRSEEYKRYHCPKKAKFFKLQALKLLDKILPFEERILELKTRKLACIISSVISSLKLLKDKNQKYMSFIISLCEELYSRKLENDLILSDKFQYTVSSLSTHFKCIEALVDAYIYTEYYCFLNACEKVFKQINRTWNEGLGLFELHKKESVIYSSKNISFTINALNKLQKVTESKEMKDKIKYQLYTFFNSSINIAGLQITSNHTVSSLNTYGNTYESSHTIENILSKKHTSFILKGFQLNKINNKINKYTDDFLWEYALHACHAMLNLAFDNYS